MQSLSFFKQILFIVFYPLKLSFLKLLTFLPIEEIKAACAGDINKAKERLAFEVTALIHRKEEAEKAKLAAEARELGISPSEVASMDNVEEMLEAKRAEEAKPKTEAEKLELTRKKALNKLDFYERVVRSVAREEAEVAGYYEIMGEEKARPSIMDEQKAEVTEQTSPAEVPQEAAPAEVQQ